MTTSGSRIHFETQGKLFGIDVPVLKIFLPSIAVGAGALASFLFVVYPKLQELPDLTQQIVTIEKKTSDIQTKYRILQNLDQEDLKRKEQLVNQALPEEKDIYFLLNLVGQVALKNQYQVDSFSVSPGEISVSTDAPPVPVPGIKSDSEKKGIISSIPLSFVAVGPEDKLLDFIGALEQSLPIISVNQQTFSTENKLTTVKAVISTYAVNPGLYPRASAGVPKEDLSFSLKELKTLEALAGYQSLFNVGGPEESKQDKKFLEYKRTDPFN